MMMWLVLGGRGKVGIGEGGSERESESEKLKKFVKQFDGGKERKSLPRSLVLGLNQEFARRLVLSSKVHS